MQTQEMEEQTTKNNNETKPKKEGVIITVYVESPKRNNGSHQKADPLKKINRNANPKTPKSRGYDRRAQLLAYSRELRNVDSPLNQLPRTKSKKCKWKARSEMPATRRLPSRRTLQRWRYARVGMMREERTEVVDQPCRPKCFYGSNKKTTGKSDSSIFVNFIALNKKLKSLLGDLSKSCKRSDDN